MAGKGSSQRPTDKAAFSSNYDAIWGNPKKKAEAESAAKSQQNLPTKTLK
jgi:hypothetical protein|tara:strand:+ start:880 stop:1029 length:150 start_codon:yes stop_codon:yes gene_type:complete